MISKTLFRVFRTVISNEKQNVMRHDEFQSASRNTFVSYNCRRRCRAMRNSCYFESRRIGPNLFWSTAGRRGLSVDGLALAAWFLLSAGDSGLLGGGRDCFGDRLGNAAIEDAGNDVVGQHLTSSSGPTGIDRIHRMDFAVFSPCSSCLSLFRFLAAWFEAGKFPNSLAGR